MTPELIESETHIAKVRLDRLPKATSVGRVTGGRRQLGDSDSPELIQTGHRALAKILGDHRGQRDRQMKAISIDVESHSNGSAILPLEDISTARRDLLDGLNKTVDRDIFDEGSIVGPSTKSIDMNGDRLVLIDDLAKRGANQVANDSNLDRRLVPLFGKQLIELRGKHQRGAARNEFDPLLANIHSQTFLSIDAA